jgi:hypothetical protein
VGLRFNPPPGWPPAPEGFVPPPGWQPDPAWPPPPPGWVLWVPDDAPDAPESAGLPGTAGETLPLPATPPAPPSLSTSGQPVRGQWQPPGQSPSAPEPPYPPEPTYAPQPPPGQPPYAQPAGAGQPTYGEAYPPGQGPYGPAYQGGAYPGQGPYSQAYPPGPSPYGQPSPGYPYGAQPRGGPTNGFAIASFILGLLGFTLVTAVLSIIFGIIALVKIREMQQRGKGLAIAGLVLSGVWLLLYIALIVIGATAAPQGSSSSLRPPPAVSYLTHASVIGAAGPRITAKPGGS